MDFLDNMKKELVKAHLVNLYYMALIDNRLLEVELAFLNELAHRHQFTDAEVQEIVERAENVDFQLPNTAQDRIQHLYEVIRMMLVDDRLDEREGALAVQLARMMKFPPGMVGSIVKALVTAKDDGAEPTLSKSELQTILENPEA